jgi:hypothetical protein
MLSNEELLLRFINEKNVLPAAELELDLPL